VSSPRSTRFTPGKDQVPIVQEALFQSNIPELGRRAEPQNLDQDSWLSGRDSNLVPLEHESEASPPYTTCSGRQSKNSGMTFIRKFIKIKKLYLKLLGGGGSATRMRVSGKETLKSLCFFIYKYGAENITPDSLISRPTAQQTKLTEQSQNCTASSENIHNKLYENLPVNRKWTGTR